MNEMQFVYNDGGREAAGFKGKTGDCVVRAVAIATGLPYAEVYAALADVNANTRSRAKGKGKRSARNGVSVRGVAFKRYMAALGWKWTPTMLIGSGCKVHLIESELPKGRLIVSLSRHYTTVIDGVIHDTFNPQRGATAWYKTGLGVTETIVDHVSPDRCVYGYWQES